MSEVSRAKLLMQLKSALKDEGEDRRPAHQVHQDRFNLRRKALLSDKAWTVRFFDKEELALTALDDLVLVLRGGRPDQETREMLVSFVQSYPDRVALPFSAEFNSTTVDQATMDAIADYLQGVADRSGKSANAWSECVKLVYLILGREQIKGTRESARAAAIDAYVVARELLAASEQHAKAAAYDAYYAALGKPNRHEADAQLATHGAESKADKFIREQLDGWLLEAGLRKEKKPGPAISKPAEQVELHPLQQVWRI